MDDQNGNHLGPGPIGMLTNLTKELLICGRASRNNEVEIRIKNIFSMFLGVVEDLRLLSMPMVHTRLYATMDTYTDTRNKNSK